MTDNNKARALSRETLKEIHHCVLEGKRLSLISGRDNLEIEVLISTDGVGLVLVSEKEGSEVKPPHLAWAFENIESLDLLLTKLKRVRADMISAQSLQGV
jgi:hypothetical protein